MQKKYRRRNYFIKKGFQSRFILKFLIVSTVGSILATVLFNFLAYKKIDAVLFSMRIPAVTPGTLFFREALFSHIAAISVVIVMFIITARGLFQKIAGPLMTVRTELRKLSGGHLSSRITLRQGDEFMDFADKINLMAQELTHKFLDMKNHAQHLSKSVREMKEAPTDHERKMIKDKMIDHIDALEKKIGEFKK